MQRERRQAGVGTMGFWATIYLIYLCLQGLLRLDQGRHRVHLMKE